MKFIYVMDERDKDKLVNAGYELLKLNKSIPVWIFLNNQEQEIDADIVCALSDTLTF